MPAMPLIEDPIAKLVEQVLGFRNQRHEVIASNIANANTPGYKAFDVILRERVDGMKPLEPTRTHARHLSQSESTTSESIRLERSREPARLDGNNVSLDQELGKLLENRVMYEVGMELRDRWGGLKKIAREVR